MGVMKILVTGATGYLGRHAVRDLANQGHHVMALSRSGGEVEGASEVIKLDLSQAAAIIPLAEILLGCDAVVHLAAVKSGCYGAMEEGIVKATDHLLSAHESAQSAARMILGSSIVVYDYEAYPNKHRFEEADRTDVNIDRRDAYAALKITQEFLWRRYARVTRVPMISLRIGALYDETSFQNSHLGWIRGRVLIQAGCAGVMPTVHVQDASHGIIQALSVGTTDNCLAINLVEPRPARRSDAVRLWRAKGVFGWRVILPYRIMAFLRWLPSFEENVMSYATLKSRFGQYFFSTEKAETVLQWAPRHSYSETLGEPGAPTR